MIAKIVNTIIEPQKERSDLVCNGCGSILEFSGVIRPYGNEKKLRGLYYDHHETMAIKILTGLVKESIEKFNLIDAIALHRVGYVPVGEISLYVAIASKHRDEGLNSMKWLLDQIKTKVPIWKKDIYEEGEEWHN